MRRIDGVYQQIKTVVLKPENKKRLTLGSAALISLAVFIFLIFTLFPFFARATITPLETENNKGEKILFSQNIEPTFILDTDGLIKSKQDKSAQGKLIIEDSKIKTELLYGDEESNILAEIKALPEKEDQFEIKVPLKNQFKPGQYQLKVILNTPTINRTIVQDFSWGVLAVNTNKSIYLPNEKAYLALAVLDQKGQMVCDADIRLEIKNPKAETKELSTSAKTIRINPECFQHQAAEKPDYETEYQVSVSGQYQIKLTATTQNGSWTIWDYFEVQESVPFDIERQGPTRIFPPVDYEMKFKIKANQDFVGQVVEQVPDVFQIQAQDAKIVPDNEQKSKKIIWQADWKVGQIYEFSYQFKAPNISPQFYLLGPLKIGDPSTSSGQAFQEIRQWQIAADTIYPDAHPSAYTLTTGFNGNFNDASYPATNAYASDNAYASTGFSDKRNKEYATNFRGFDFSGIPDGSVINSVNVYIERKVDIANGVAEWKSSVWADVTVAAALEMGTVGAIGPDLQYATSTNPTSDAYWNYPLTGTLPTVAQLKGANFGIRVQADNNNSGTDCEYFIDDIYIVVDYTASAPISIGGTVYGTDESTPIATGPLVRVKVNGLGDYSANANGSGVYDIASVPTATTGTAVTVYLDTGGGITGATFTIATGSSMSNIHIYQDRVSTRCDNSCSLTNANIDNWDKTNDTDIHANVASPNLTVDNDWKLRVSTDTFAPAGTVTMSTGGANSYSGDVEIKSGTTLDMASNALSISGNYTNGGTATLSSNTTSFTKTSGTQDVDSGGTDVGKRFNEIDISSGTTRLINNTLRASNIEVAGTAALNCNSQSLYINFSGASYGGLGLADGATFIKGGTLTLEATTSGIYTVIEDENTISKQDFGDVVAITSTGGEAGTNSEVKLTTLTVTADSVFDPSVQTMTILGSGTPLVLESGSSFNTAESTIIYAGTSATNITATAYNNLTFTPESGTPTYTLLGDLTVANAMASNLTISGNATLDTGLDYNIALAGNWSNAGTFTPNASTVNFTEASSTQTLDSGGTGAGKFFNNLTHSGAGTLQLITNAINIDGIFTNSAGTFDANDLNMNVADDFLISGGFFSADVSPGATTQTVTFDGTNEATVSGSSTFNHLTMNTTTDGAKTIKFTASTTQTINGTWTLDGDVGKVLTLRSTSDDTAWEFVIPADINPSGDYIDVRDSQNNTNAYRITAGANTTDSGNNVPGWLFAGGNNPPNSPSGLVQKKTDDTVLATGDWTDETSVKYTATVTDPDTDQVRLCVEKDNLATSFSDAEDLCGDLVDSGQTASVTITSQTDDTQYHWQARAKDSNDAYSVSWVSYGGNGEGERDYGIDTTAPTGGTVNDGTSGDQDWNDGTLDSISANWSGFDASVSDLDKYEYAARRASDDYYWNAGGSTWQSGESWVDNGATTSVTVNPIYLHTGESYYFSVKATDNALNTASAVDSNGQQISPTLSFAYDTNTIAFDDLNNGNSWTDTKTNTFTTSTNAYSGYTIQGYFTQLLTSLAYPSETVANFYGTWLEPEPWPGGTYGFGYTSSDTLVQGSNRFNGGTEYAAFSQTASGDVVADHTDAVTGETGAVSSEEFILTYKVAVSQTQLASAYRTYVIYICTANY